MALSSLAAMIQVGKLPNDHIYPSAAKSCAAVFDPVLGRSVHGVTIKTSFDSDIFVGSSLVDMYAKLGEIKDARKMFDGMPSKNIVSWSGMIYGYAQMGMEEEALQMFKTVLIGDGVQSAGGDPGGVNDFTYSCVIRVCGSATYLELGRQIHGHCFKASFISSSFVGSSLISLYSKCGSPEEAHQIFDEMPTRNLGAWNSILVACSQHGHTDKGFSIFNRMKTSGINPNFITFLCLLSACSHSGLIEEGKELFNSMERDYQIKPEPHHYACIIDLLSRAGKIQEALDFINEMPTPPTDSVWGALLTGAKIHGNTVTAELAAKNLFNLGSRSCGAHMLLAGAYAAAGDFESAAKTRKLMRDRGLKKETGLSWIELGFEIHTFVSGDKRHPMTDPIYAKLEEITETVVAMGYVPDTKFVPRDLDAEEKKIAVREHSERLAVCFALICLPPERTIRVMKNLRVCGDCHAWLKHVSNCTDRAVVVRDNNRFHRFEGGACSCGDYW